MNSNFSEIPTPEQYDQVVASCRHIFKQKNSDYGTAWRILRPSSLTDQIFIKAQRIRSIEESGENKVGESIENEFIGIVNYCLIALIQLTLNGEDEIEIAVDRLLEMYDKEVSETKTLMSVKNHDYGEAWRSMRISTFTDLILMKVLRTKQIEDNSNKTLISEGVDANYRDMINYSIFALIRSKETS